MSTQRSRPKHHDDTESDVTPSYLASGVVRHRRDTGEMTPSRPCFLQRLVLPQWRVREALLTRGWVGL